MAKRHPNNRRVKIHRSYTVDEIARLFGIHKNTVRQWLKSGLPTIDSRRPTMARGADLIAFLRMRRAAKKRRCLPGQIYCVCCRDPKFPAGRMVEYQPIAPKIGNLTAICPDCGCLINRRVNLAKLDQVRGEMDITFPQALSRLNESNQPTVNSDLR